MGCLMLGSQDRSDAWEAPDSVLDWDFGSDTCSLSAPLESCQTGWLGQACAHSCPFPVLCTCSCTTPAPLICLLCIACPQLMGINSIDPSLASPCAKLHMISFAPKHIFVRGQ